LRTFFHLFHSSDLPFVTVFGAVCVNIQVYPCFPFLHPFGVSAQLVGGHLLRLCCLHRPSFNGEDTLPAFATSLLSPPSCQWRDFLFSKGQTVGVDRSFSHFHPLNSEPSGQSSSVFLDIFGCRFPPFLGPVLLPLKATSS